MALKILFKYHDQSGGFSEYWIDNTATIGTPTAIQNLTRYLTVRLQFSGSNTFWDYVRLSTVGGGTLRQVLTYYPSDPAFVAVPLNGSFEIVGSRRCARDRPVRLQGDCL